MASGWEGRAMQSADLVLPSRRHGRGRPRRATQDLGTKLVQARKEGVAWKLLVEETGFSRTRLYQIWRDARKK